MIQSTLLQDQKNGRITGERTSTINKAACSYDDSTEADQSHFTNKTTPPPIFFLTESHVIFCVFFFKNPTVLFCKIF